MFTRISFRLQVINNMVMDNKFIDFGRIIKTRYMSMIVDRGVATFCKNRTIAALFVQVGYFC
jgi:ribosomal 50S subunit-recycling heat shock protein